MRRHALPIALAGITLAVTTAACGSSTTTSTPASPAASPTTAETSAPATTTDAMTKDIVDTAVAAGDFTTLATALKAAGLVETLKGAGPFTVFAPPDSAFAKLPADTVPTLLKDPKGELTKILTYHVVPGKVMAADVAGLAGKKVKTVQGGEFTVNVAGGAVSLTDGTGKKVNVAKTDIEASNGVIHVLDGVLMPPAK